MAKAFTIWRTTASTAGLAEMHRRVLCDKKSSNLAALVMAAWIAATASVEAANAVVIGDQQAQFRNAVKVLEVASDTERHSSINSVKIKAPPEFYRLARAFHEDSRMDAKDEREWIATALEFLDAPSRQVVKQFLTDLLRQNPSEADLQELWNSTEADYFIVGHDGYEAMRHFLTTIRDQIE
jgi:hypothetical protein